MNKLLSYTITLFVFVALILFLSDAIFTMSTSALGIVNQSFTSRLILLACSLISIVILYKKNNDNKLTIYKYINLFSIYIIIISALLLPEINKFAIADLIKIIFPLTTFWAFILINNRYDETRLLNCFLFSIMIFVAIFYLRDLKFIILNSNQNMNVLNSAYFTLFSLPIALLNRNKYIRITAWIIAIIVLTTALKRTGIIALILGGTLYLLSFKNNKFKSFIFLFFLISIGTVFFNIFKETEIISNLVNRFDSILEDNGSGRDIVYQETWEMISNSKMIDKIIGHGYNSVVRDSKINFSAHNDFLEIIYDFGYIGLVFYVMFHLSFVNLTIKLLKIKSELGPPMVMQYTFFLVISCFSHVIIYSYYILILIFLALIISRISHKQNNY